MKHGERWDILFAIAIGNIVLALIVFALVVTWTQ